MPRWRTAFQVDSMIDALAAIDRSLPLRERMVAAVEIAQTRLRSVFKLLLAMRMHRPPDWKSDPDEEARRKRRRPNAPTRPSWTCFRPDADELRFPPAEVCHRLRLITFSATHPLISDGRTLTAEEIVDFALDGVRIQLPGGN